MACITIQLNDDTITAYGRSENTRSGFRHLVEIYVNNYEVASGKACYLNRTWECYQYETAFHIALEKAVKEKRLTKEKAEIIRNAIDTHEKERGQAFIDSMEKWAKAFALLMKGGA